jgi:hypothetical protein
MKVVFNNIIPFDGFAAINLFGILFVRNGVYKNNRIPSITFRHEKIHTEQIKELGYVFFYVWYFIEWLVQLCLHGKYAYYWISFEREAFDNENNIKYLDNRKHYSWLKYYGSK